MHDQFSALNDLVREIERASDVVVARTPDAEDGDIDAQVDVINNAITGEQLLKLARSLIEFIGNEVHGSEAAVAAYTEALDLYERKFHGA
jgi:predicted nucleotidyltransferase